MMGIDCLDFFTLYVGVLAVVVESMSDTLPGRLSATFIPSIQVRRIKAMCAAKKAIENVRSSRTNSPTIPGTPELPTPPRHTRIVDSIIGEKGGVDWCGDGSKFVNPVTRLKLLLVRLQYLWMMIIALVLTVYCRSLLSSHSQSLHDTYASYRTQSSHSILRFINLIRLGSVRNCGCLTSNSNPRRYVFISCCVCSIRHGHRPSS